jgi:hypothetical protein
MLDSKVLNQMAAAYEAVVEKRFKKLGYALKQLDRQKARARPDFLISNSAGPQLLCEVKTVFSGGYLRDKGVHVSMMDDSPHNFGVVLQSEIDLSQIRDDLADAVRKRAALVADDSQFKNVPLLVAFVFDFFADFLPFYPRSFNVGVSGILTIEKDVAMTRAFEQLPIKEHNA